ncbi:hypothetical protein [Actinomadura sp. 9N407]|uniref:hypothetical protein n=1 Tax=Actinomadura sp. 9N407 TaxID=3375154 RepID=UPI0037ACF478
MTEDQIIETLRRLPGLPPPAAPEAVADAERIIGYPIPPLLRRLYLEVANGEFGPREGILAVDDGSYEHSDGWLGIVDAHGSFNHDGSYPGLVWLFDWGCLIWSVIDFRDPAGPMWGWDPNIDPDEDSTPIFSQNMNFTEWLGRSLDGSLEEAFEENGLWGFSSEVG